MNLWDDNKWNVVYLHSRMLFSNTKQNELIIYTTAWMELKDSELGEIGQIQRQQIIWLHVYEMPKQANLLSQRSSVQRSQTREVGCYI